MENANPSQFGFPPQAVPRSGRIFRRFVRAILLWPPILLSLVCIVYYHPIKDRIILLYLQRQCLNFQNTGTPVSYAGNQPMPAAWVNFCAANGTSIYAQQTGCVFLGRMKRPDGVERIVMVTVDRYMGLVDRLDRNIVRNPDGSISIIRKPDVDCLAEMYWTVVKPAGLLQYAEPCESADWLTAFSESTDIIHMPYSEKPDELHNDMINGAVLDPANPSHFTIQVLFSDGLNYPIDGYLQNDDTLRVHQDEHP